MSVTLVLIILLILLIVTQITGIVEWRLVPTTRTALALPYQWAVTLGLLVALLYSVGLLGSYGKDDGGSYCLRDCYARCYRYYCGRCEFD